MDAQTLSVLRQTVAEHVGLPEQMADRIRGETLAELQADAGKLMAELGLTPSESATPIKRARDEAGRFAAGNDQMNDAIRGAARRPNTGGSRSLSGSGQALNNELRRLSGRQAPPPEERPVGDVLGRGVPGKAIFPKPQPTGMTAALKGAWATRKELAQTFAENVQRLENQ